MKISRRGLVAVVLSVSVLMAGGLAGCEGSVSEHSSNENQAGNANENQVNDPPLPSEEKIWIAQACLTAAGGAGYIGESGEWFMEPQFAVYVDGSGESSPWSYSPGIATISTPSGNSIYTAIDIDAGTFFGNGLAIAAGAAGPAAGGPLSGIGWIDTSGQFVITDERFSYVHGFINGVAGVKRGDRWGVMDLSGEWVVEPKFYYLSYFNEAGLAVAQLGEDDDFEGLVNTSGEWVLAPDRYTSISPDEDYEGNPIYWAHIDGLFVTDSGELSTYLLDSDFSVVFSIDDLRPGSARVEVEDFGGRRLAAVNVSDYDNKWSAGFIDVDGEWVIEPNYTMAWGFAGNGLASVKVGELYGFIDESGAFVIEPQYGGALGFSNGFARVSTTLGGDKFYINEKNERLNQTLYKDASNFSGNGLAAVREVGSDLFGYINTSGEWAIEPQFYFAENFVEVDEDGWR
ncbi:MAG: WG repeat-containing protein [Propionibacteriaceae bacterium]|jgi:hypothetical protein|nr:WG repeat-containing protein [Propionibacteriaceae bacterium]